MTLWAVVTVVSDVCQADVESAKRVSKKNRSAGKFPPTDHEKQLKGQLVGVFSPLAVPKRGFAYDFASSRISIS